MTDKHIIPQHLDTPPKIMLWTLDEFAVLMLPFIIFLVGLNSPLTGIVIGVTGLTLLKMLKGEEGHYFIFYLSFWYLPSLLPYHKTPPSHLRFWIG